MRNRVSRPKTLTANVGEVIVKGTAKQIVANLERLGYDAERAKNKVLAQTYFQGAEHYKRIDNHV